MGQKLPNNWVISTIGGLLDVNMGQSPPSSSYNEEGVGIPFMQGKTEFGDYYPKIKKYTTEPKKVVQPGTVLLSVRAPIGPTNVSDSELCIGRGLAGISSDIIPTNFLLYYLRSIADILEAKGTGTTFKAISKDKLLDTIFPLPPFAEQQRIVAKLDGLFGHLEAAKTRLEKVPQLLKNFRQAILTQAVSGKLTEEWRVGKELGEWDHTTLGVVCEITMGQSPPGSTYNDQGLGTPLINGPLEFGGIDPFSKTKKIKFTTQPKKMCDENDLLICVRGSTTGRLNIAGFKACIGRGVAAIKAISVKQEYVNIFMRLQYAKILSEGTGTTFPSISGNYIKDFKISKPKTEEEQTEIVKRVEALFTNADAIEKKYKSLKHKIDNLPQAIVNKAFKGELVEQLDTDGDARELLKEIKKLKEKEKAKPKSKIKKRTAVNKKKLEIQPITKVLEDEKIVLDSQELFSTAGYPLDADTEVIEQFFLELRKGILDGQIESHKEGNKEFFKKKR